MKTSMFKHAFLSLTFAFLGAASLPAVSAECQPNGNTVCAGQEQQIVAAESQPTAPAKISKQEKVTLALLVFFFCAFTLTSMRVFPSNPEQPNLPQS